MDLQWKEWYFNRTNEVRAKRKSKRNRAWRAIHRNAKKLEAALITGKAENQTEAFNPSSLFQKS